MKDTAVKFLIDEISCRFIISEELRIAMYKAIEMEKEQIIETWHDGFCNKDITAVCNEDIRAIQYYNETFKSE